MSVFGNIITDDMVEDAVVTHLKTWLPTYLAEVEGQTIGEDKRGFYKRPPESSYTARADFDKWPEEELPFVIVVAPGIDDDPVKDGRGHFRAHFQIGVVCVVSSTSELATRRYAYRMGAAVRAALIQKPSLGRAFDDAVRGVTWVGSRNNELPDDSADRSLWANQQLFVVEVDGILSRTGGPAEPIPGPIYVPGPDDPFISSTTQTLESVNV